MTISLEDTGTLQELLLMPVSLQLLAPLML